MSTTTIRLPDGSEVDIQTSDPKAAAATARKIWQQRQGSSAEEAGRKPRSGWQTAGDFLGDAIDNFVPNFGDEIAAIPDAAKAAVRGQPIGEAWNKGRREFRRNQAQYDKEHPYLAWGSTLTGAGASLALPAGRVASGAGMATKVLHGAAVGAGYGAVAGAGEGDSLGDRATNAAKGMAAGGVLGGAMSPVAAGAVRVGRIARQALPGVDGAVRRLANVPRAVMRHPLRTPEDAQRRLAARFMDTRMNEGHVAAGFGQQGASATPETLLAEVERRRALGVPAMLGDVSEPMRATTGWASRGMGPGQTMVRERLDARKAQEATRIRQHIADTMGDLSPDPVGQYQGYGERARREAGPMYAEAYAQPMVLTPEISGIMQTPAFQAAVPHAVRNIRNAQRNPEAIGFVMRNDGMLDPEAYQSLSTEGFDQVIRAMRDNAQDRMRPASFPGGRPTNTTDSVHINARAGDLRDELANQNGAYRDVTEMYADEMGMRDAFQNGQVVDKLTGPDIAAQARQMPQDNAREAWAIGARTALGDRASEFGSAHPTGDVAGNVRRMLGPDQKQTAIQQMMPDRPDAVSGLQDRLEAEHQSNILWREAYGNSRTADRQQFDADMDQTLGALPIPPVTPSAMVARAANLVQTGVTRGRRQSMKDQVARFVTEENPERLRAFVNDVSEVAQRDRDFADRLHRMGVFGTKGAAMNVKGEEPGEFPSGQHEPYEDERDY
ncbi:hypothetical protein [Sphingomonas phyllosphaerae]|uniref:hypothetical protein n=1 Tax=Sphingomonas phyllosphaerae TaxID=257003 RepID=UPI0003B3A4DC|nr:hypothetical protein [Sphingomonas phyllosphaerae]